MEYKRGKGNPRKKSVSELETEMEFLETGKKRLKGDTKREASITEVFHLKHENNELKQLVAKLSLQNWMLKKSPN